MRSSLRAAAGICLAALALAAAKARAAAAVHTQSPREEQTRQAGPSDLRGRVVDGASGEPLTAVSLALYAADAAENTASKLCETSTGHDGGYRFSEVPTGRYVLLVRRLGYRDASVDLDVGAGVRARVSVAIDLEPIALTPVEVSVPGEIQMLSVSGHPIGVGRVTAERSRQERFLTSDARIMGRTDITEAVTLGEDDVFRAIQRAPGVSSRDDLAAELWTRGADWGHTRVYLDGMPLFNPLHGFGILSGVSPHAVGSIAFHPGVRSAALPEGAAAVLDLRSRSGLASPELEGGVDLSLVSTQAWASAATGEHSGWAANARRSWIDVAADGFDEGFPYRFWDAQVRADAALSPDLRIEGVGLIEHDRIAGDLPDVLNGNTSTWGNVLGSISLGGSIGRDLSFRQTIGFTRYTAVVDSLIDPAEPVLAAPTEPPSDHRIDFAAVRGEIGPDGIDGGTWRAGYDLSRQRSRYDGPTPWPYSERPPELPRVSGSADLFRASAWGWRRWAAGEGATIETGLRVAFGTETAEGSVEVLPSILARWDVDGSLALTAGAGRFVQYAQSPAPVGPRIEGVMQTGRRWVVASRETPHVTADMATVGAERWFGDHILASATAYLRHSEGVLLPDATPGLLIQRSPFVEGTTQAHGFEIGLRKLAGQTTGSLGYSWAHTEAKALGISYLVPTHRAHSLDATLLHRLTGSWSVSAALTAASGSPYTRVLDCDTEDCEGVVLDDPFGRIGPSMGGLDLALHYRHDFAGWWFGAVVQCRNVVGGTNEVTYRDTEAFCPDGSGILDGRCTDGDPPTIKDEFVQGVPRLPLLVLRVGF